MKIGESEKVYIGKVEAFELAQERGFFELPRKGKQIVTCYSIAEKAMTGKNDVLLGKDENGYYTADVFYQS
jgi:hypothetical protein